MEDGNIIDKVHQRLKEKGWITSSKEELLEMLKTKDYSKIGIALGGREEIDNNIDNFFQNEIKIKEALIQGWGGLLTAQMNREIFYRDLRNELKNIQYTDVQRKKAEELITSDEDVIQGCIDKYEVAIDKVELILSDYYLLKEGWLKVSSLGDGDEKKLEEVGKLNILLGEVMDKLKDSRKEINKYMKNDLTSTYLRFKEYNKIMLQQGWPLM